MDLKIEEAVIDDIPGMLAVQVAAFTGEAALYGVAHIEPMLETQLELESEFKKCRFFKASDQSGIIGAVRVENMSGGALLRRLCVRPDRQGQGVGAALMDKAESEYAGLGVMRLFTGHRSLKNLDFYSRRGYRETGRIKKNDVLTIVYMEKKLEARHDPCNR